MSEYCKTCVNVDTPICDLCSTVHTAKGALKPSKYCGYSTDDTSDILIEDLSAVIQARAKNNRQISIRHVMKYNRLLEENKNGKKENISTSQNTCHGSADGSNDGTGLPAP